MFFADICHHLTITDDRQQVGPVFAAEHSMKKPFSFEFRHNVAGQAFLPVYQAQTEMSVLLNTRQLLYVNLRLHLKKQNLPAKQCVAGHR